MDNKRTVLFMVLLGLSPVRPVHAAFDDIGVGARAPGMADVFVGVADDVNALYYNPAGLAQLRYSEFTGQFSSLNRDLTDGSKLGTTYAGYGQPIKGGQWGAFGLGYHSFKLTSLYEERMVLLGYGRQFNQWFAGSTLKYLSRKFGSTAYTDNALNDNGVASGRKDALFDQNGFSNSDFALDLGTLYQFGGKGQYNLGLSLVNINRPDVSLGGDNDHPPFITKLGFAYRSSRAILSVEMRRVKKLESRTQDIIAFGGEKSFHFRHWGSFDVRAGYAQGSGEFRRLTTGFSYLFDRIQLDYSFDFPLGNLGDTQGSHRMALSIRWGGDPISKEVQSIIDIELLGSLKENGRAALFMVNRALNQLRFTTAQKNLSVQYIVHRFPSIAASKLIRRDLERNPRKSFARPMDWATLKKQLTGHVPGKERDLFARVLELLRYGMRESALEQMEYLSSQAQKNPIVKMIKMVALTELAAETYRNGDHSRSLHYVEKLEGMLPSDQYVENARQNLSGTLARRHRLTIRLAPYRIYREELFIVEDLTVQKEENTPGTGIDY